jgi:hypothetical protein
MTTSTVLSCSSASAMLVTGVRAGVPPRSGVIASNAATSTSSSLCLSAPTSQTPAGVIRTGSTS